MRRARTSGLARWTCWLLLALIAAGASRAASTATKESVEAPIMMEKFQVRPSDLVFNVHYTILTDAITELRVAEVARGSTAEKLGLRKGDRLTAINGLAVAGIRRRALVSAEGRISVAGRLTFEGERGLFRRPWSTTVTTAALREKDAVPAVAPRADEGLAPRSGERPGPAATIVPR